MGQRTRRNRPYPWSVVKACTFLEKGIDRSVYCVRHTSWILVHRFRKGEVLGLTWSDVTWTREAPHPSPAPAGSPATRFGSISLGSCDH